MYNELIRDLYFGVFLVLGFSPNTAIVKNELIQYEDAVFFHFIVFCWNIYLLEYF